MDNFRITIDKSFITNLLKLHAIIVFIAILIYIFGTLLLFIINELISVYTIIFIPFIYLIFKYLNNLDKEYYKSTTDKIFNSGYNSNFLPIRIVIFQFFSTLTSHLVGASVGREGVAIQIGGTLSNYLKYKFNITWSSKFLTQIGMATGFSALFGTPLSAVVLIISAYRVYDIRKIFVLLYCSYISSMITTYLGLSHFKNKLENINLDYFDVFKLILIALILSIFSQIFIYVLKKLKKFLSSKLILGLLISVILMLLLLATQQRYVSLGLDLIYNSFDDISQVFSYDFILKALFTICFLSLGFQGGEVTPLFAIGATFGVFMSSILNIDSSLTAALCYCFMFANVTNLFLVGSFMALEVFGFQVAIISIIFYLVSKLTVKISGIYPLK